MSRIIVAWLKVISLQVTKLKTSGIFCRSYYYNVVSYVHIHLVPYNFHCIFSVGEKMVIFEISRNFLTFSEVHSACAVKKSGTDLFKTNYTLLGIFEILLAMFLRYQPYDSDAIALIGP